MPGTAAHLTIMELQTERALATPTAYGPVAKVLSAHPQHAALGAIGPDMLFWADWAQYTNIVNAIFDVYQRLDEIYDQLQAVWEPIEQAKNKVLSSLTGGLSEELNRTVQLLKATITAAMTKLITEQVDLFAFLRPKFQYVNVPPPPLPESMWSWLDYLHHRRTGRFAKVLIRNAVASGNPKLQAYAYGWLSHVTADVVGHAYVNQAVGGPWRTHYQRHHIQENFMDVWTWGFYHTPGVKMPTSAVAGDIPFDYGSFANLSSANLHKKIEFGDNLPPQLQNLIAESLQEVYRSVPHPVLPALAGVGADVEFLGPSEINRAYQMLAVALELMTGKDRYIPRPTAPSILSDDAPPTFPSPPGSGGGTGGGGGGGSFSLKSLLSAIRKYISDLLDYAGDLALWLIKQATTPFTYPIRYGMYLLQLALWESYRHYRWALVVTGYVFPDPDQLQDTVAQQFINPSGRYERMPIREWQPEQDHCLHYPASQPEEPSVLPGPYTRHPVNYPYWFIEGEPTDLAVERLLVDASSPEKTADVTRRLVPDLVDFAAVGNLTPYKGGLGSAVDFYLRRAEEVAAAGGGADTLTLPDWNLDADRGYGFKCWEAKSRLEPPPSGGVVVTNIEEGE